MSIAFKCECGRAYVLADGSAGCTIRCLSCKQPMTVPARTRTEHPSGVSPTAAHVEPTVPPHRLDSAVSQLDPPSETPSIKRGFTRTDLAVAVGGILMAAAFLWYFIGYRLFGGERLYPAGAMLLMGLSFMVRNILRDMQE